MAYVAGTDLTFQVDLINAAGQAIPATSVQYRVLDEVGGIKADWQPIVGYTSGPASVTVLAAVNALEQGQTRAGREIELLCTLADGSKQYATKFYIIEGASGQLVRGVNTLVTVTGAEMIAVQIPGLVGWNSANRLEKTAALIEAYRRLGKLRFAELSNCWYDRSGGPFASTVATSLLDLSADEVLGLDPKALSAIALGQVSEADFVLSPDSVESRRREGLVLDTIGEVKQMFRSGRPLELPVSKRTLGYVSKYMNVGSKVIGRT